MTNMKMSEEESAEYNDTVMAPRPAYPYGLCLYLDDEALKKLGLDKLPELDQVISFKAKAQVVNLSARKDGDDDESCSVSLQITDMEVVNDGEGKDYAQRLYKEKG